MEILVLIFMTALLVLGFAFQIRDVYITMKYKGIGNLKPACVFLRIYENERGHVICECGNHIERKFVRTEEDSANKKDTMYNSIQIITAKFECEVGSRTLV